MQKTNQSDLHCQQPHYKFKIRNYNKIKNKIEYNAGPSNRLPSNGGSGLGHPRNGSY